MADARKTRARYAPSAHFSSVLEVYQLPQCIAIVNTK